MSDAALVAIFVGVAFLLGTAWGRANPAADWSRTGTDCTCLDPVERSARRSCP